MKLKFLDKSRIYVSELLADTISYVSQKYNQSINAFTPASAYGQIILVFEDIMRIILFYIQDSITELNIHTAKRNDSIRGWAAFLGHDATRAISASGEVEIVSKTGENNDITGNFLFYPNLSKIRCLKNNRTYSVLLGMDDVRVYTDPLKKTSITIVEGQFESQSFTGTGEDLQSFEVNMQTGKRIDQNRIEVYVNDERIAPVKQSLYALPIGKGCLVRTGISSGIDIIFGNDVVGFKPKKGSAIRIDYLITNGNAGNIFDDGDVLYEFVDTGFDINGKEVNLNDHFRIVSKLKPNFGSNEEAIELTRIIAPQVNESGILDRPMDYVYHFEKMNYFSIIDAYDKFSDSFIDDENVIHLFLVPDIKNRMRSDEDYFGVSDSKFILNDTEKARIYNSINESEKKSRTSVINIVNPILRRYVINIIVDVFDNYRGKENFIKSEIKANLSEYFLSIRRRDKIPESDLIAIIENIEGIDAVKLFFVSEENEKSKINNPLNKEIGIDDLGNILIGRDELPIIRGGWEDRNGVFYSHDFDVTSGKPSAVNINFRYTAYDSGVALNTIKRGMLKNK